MLKETVSLNLQTGLGCFRKTVLGFQLFSVDHLILSGILQQAKKSQKRSYEWYFALCITSLFILQNWAISLWHLVEIFSN